MEEKNQTQDKNQDQTQTLKEFVKNSKLALIETIEDIDDPIQKHNILANEARNVNDIILSHEKILSFINSLEKALLEEAPELSTNIRIQKALENGLGIYNVLGKIRIDIASPCFKRNVFSPIELPLVKNELEKFIEFNGELLAKKIESYMVITNIDLYEWSKEDE